MIPPQSINPGVFTPNQLGLMWLQTDNAVISDNKSGTTVSVSQAGATTTLVVTGTPFATTDDLDMEILISGAANPGNNGYFNIATRPSSNTVTYTNPAGVSETFAGSWVTSGKCSSLTSRDASAKTFANGVALNRFNIDKATKPGHVMLRRNNISNQKFLTLSDATYGALFQGDTPLTFGTYAKFTQLVSNFSHMQIADSGAFAPTNAAGVYRTNLTPNQTDAARIAAAAQTSSLVSYTISSTTFELYTRVYRGGGLWEEYVSGVSKGTSSGTVRAPATINFFQLGAQVSGAPLNTFGGFFFAPNFQMSPTQMVQLKAWYDQSFA